MAQSNIETRWHLLDDARAVAAQAALWIQRAASRAIAQRGWFSIVLAGGNTPRLAYRLLVDTDTDWSRWVIYFGDERCLPPDHRDRNSRMAAAAWLDAVPIPADNVHVIPAQLGAEVAAPAYAKVIRAALPFDLVLLGIGEDGHTASLFPGQHHPAGQLVHAVYQAPKPPPERVSLSAQALSETSELLVLATGADKAPAVRAWRSGVALPVAQVGAAGGVDVLLDKAADG